MTIEEFLRGCFDCGYEACVTLRTDGAWQLSVYESSNVYEARHKFAEATSFAAVLAALEAEPWGMSTKDAIAAARTLGDWPGSGGTGE